ncbi:hypothetical protein, partial [Burkholderia cenocepacia]|uniref:hypothetical protein n=1 Tax=Burkholderia cenocepacia TaxID=95486 RepID=UPI00222FA1CA
VASERQTIAGRTTMLEKVVLSTIAGETTPALSASLEERDNTVKRQRYKVSTHSHADARRI